VNAWGNPRTTQDIDISLFVGYGNEGPFIERLLQDFPSRIKRGAKDFAETNRVVLLADKDGIPIDVGLAGLPIEEEMIDRALPFNVGNKRTLKVVAPNDLIAMKVFANRDRDWVDIADLVTRQEKNIDWKHINQCVKIMCQLSEISEPLMKLRTFQENLRKRKD
jgi:hypothetical protein